MTEFKWKVRCYYANRPNVLALETVHQSDESKDIEVKAAESNPLFGKIVVIRLSRSS